MSWHSMSWKPQDHSATELETIWVLVFVSSACLELELSRIWGMAPHAAEKLGRICFFSDSRFWNVAELGTKSGHPLAGWSRGSE